MCLADHRFETFEQATMLAIKELWTNILAVDATITTEDTTKTKMREKESFKKFLKEYCKVPHYMFSVKKFNSAP